MIVAFRQLAKSFDPNIRDENIDYCIATLDELVKKFAGVTPPPKQEALF